MALTAEQKRVLARIKSIGRQVGASPKELKAAVETGLVEANLTNPSVMTDHDSLGWRQERASLYPNPMNLDASIKRFFQETKAVKHKYGRAGDLAAAVQRPAAQYRGRYQERSAEADRLLGSMLPSSGAVRSTPAKSTEQTVTTPGVDNSGARASAALQFLRSKSKDPVYLAQQVQGLQDTPAVTKTTTTPTGTTGGTTPSAKPTTNSDGRVGGGPLLELFWQGAGGINAKNGQRVEQGFVSGHTNHVHVASGPVTTRRLGKLAQEMGLHVGENNAFGGVAPVHVQNSNHYHDRAIDVSGDPAKMRAFAHRVAKMYKVRGA